MKKIMFNDRYGLTQAVLEGKKTMTRRIIKGIYVAVIHLKYEGSFIGKTADGKSVILPQPTYKIGEEIAIAQPYKNDDVLSYNAIKEDGTAREDGFHRHKEMLGSNGYRNKMFVKAEYMPHRIRITGIKVERLQDISEEDCLREGIQEYFPYIDRNPNDRVRTFQYFRDGKIRHRRWPASECFSLLIDDICGHGTWNRNPWVYAYTFELLK